MKMKSLIHTLTILISLLLAAQTGATELAQSAETIEEMAEQGDYDELTMTEVPDTEEEREETIVQDVDCSGNNNEIRIEDWDPATRTFEVIDTACDGQGPFYATIEAIGESVPVLWLKTDPSHFLNKTFRTGKELKFHDSRDLAARERNSRTTIQRRGGRRTIQNF
jgi:hypothetical protein